MSINKKLLLASLSLFLLIFSYSIEKVSAQDKQESLSNEHYSSDYGDDLPLCPPGVYIIPPDDCIPLGTSKILTDLAKKGLTIPLKPLPASKPDADLTQLEIKYAKLNLPPDERAAFYPNLESAISGVGAFHWIGPGQLMYLAYTQQADVGGGHFVQVENNEWVRASPTNYSNFQGLEFSSTPKNNFGWIIERTNPYRDSNYQSKQLDVTLERESVVQVYDTAETNNTTWFMIGPGEWVEQRYISVVDIRTTPPEGVNNNRWIEINLSQQNVSVYENNQLIFAALAATGVDPYFTQPGLFPIYEKTEAETMTGAFEPGKADYYYLDKVPWTMYFDQSRALHGAYWRALFGYAQSHGCVNLSVGDAHWLYNWAQEGDWVYVWDPSGKTPTDPDFYGAGGA